MKYRTLGKTGARISEVGLGTWQLGGLDWGNVSDEEALRILHRSIELGVNFIDTADVYGAGRSEQLVGRFLKESRTPVYVATKVGRRGDPGWPENFTLSHIRRHTEDSLRRLGVDCLFLQQWHCIPIEMIRDCEVLEHLETIKKEGLIQNWGCSVESVEEAVLAMNHPGCGTLQVIYNIFRQKLTTDLLPVAQKNQVGILARVPLASGLLTGKFDQHHRFSEKDHRNYNKDGKFFNVGETFAGVPFEKGVEFVDKIRAILKPSDSRPLAQLALRWLLDQEAVSSVIPGASKVGQVDGNVAAGDIPPLDAAAHRALKDLYDREIAPTIRGYY